MPGIVPNWRPAPTTNARPRPRPAESRREEAEPIWIDNAGLVLVAPLAALGRDVHYDYADVGFKVSVAFVVFCLAASSIYLINDARDVEADRALQRILIAAGAAGIGGAERDAVVVV